MRSRLRVIELETRDCLAMPTIGGCSLQYLAGHTARISGTVFDEAPASATVFFRGVAEATSVTPNAYGIFFAVVTVTQPGEIYMQALDSESLLSPVRTVVYSNAPPRLVGFDAERISKNRWVLSGTVQDEYAPGLTVRFSSAEVDEADGKVALAQEFGYFRLVIQINEPGADGIVQAVVHDWWGVASSVAYAWVDSMN